MTASASKQTTAEASAVPPPAQADSSPARGESIDPAHRHVMIAEAAFYIAQARGFTPSQEFDDWLAAEREIEHRLSSPDR
jgi:hypothetical protein